MKVGFIGAGKVGTAMGCYLLTKNISVSGYYSRSFSSAQYAASKTDATAYCDLLCFVESSDLIFLTVPDDAIESVAQRLSMFDLTWGNRIVCHMSGVHSSDILNLLYEKNSTVCSLHPLLSFAELQSSVNALGHTPFTLEGKGFKLDELKNLLTTCGNNIITISSADKPLYHAAACVLSNYMVTLMDTGISMLKSIGFDKDQIIQLIEPLITKTISNAMKIGTVDALTGPISRCDLGTLELHLSKLIKNQQWLRIYKAMGLQTADFALREGRLDYECVSKIKEVLNKYE